MPNRKPYVVMVTGGNGFLGQHIVGLLQTKADHVTEIRVLDVTPYVNKLDYYKHTKPLTHFTGSVTDLDQVLQATRGVDCVMHIASLVDTSLLPNTTTSYNINVVGTQNILKACRQNHVTRLIYCSSVEVVTGQEDIHDGTEANTSHPVKHLFTVYGPTKVAAEKLVLQANDDSLKTLSLRPCVMYGELDARYLGQSFKVGKRLGSYVRFECKNNVMEHAYVGNVAWAFVCADRHLHQNDKVTDGVTGNAFFICDDSPRMNMFDFQGMIFRKLGMKPIPVAIPRWTVLTFLYCLYILFSIISFLRPVNFAYGLAPFLLMGKKLTFNGDKARQRFGYTPLFSYEQAKERTAQYLKTL